MDQQPALVTPIYELVLCLAQAVDLVSPLVADHHKRTAQITYALGRQLKLSTDELMDLVIAAALHDVGGLTQQDRLVALDFEYQNPYGHAVMSYLLLRSFPPFQKPAEIVRFHHVPWCNGAGKVFDNVPVPDGSHLLQLADRIAILIDQKKDVLEQVDDIMCKVCEQEGERFNPEHVAALKQLAKIEAFWLDTIYLVDLGRLSSRLKWKTLAINQDEFLGLTDLFRRIIDFRSQFTATHSAGVASTAECLARLCEFSEADCWMMHLAGLMHDLGKLAVPAEILEKPAILTKEEFDVMRRHTYFTFHILEPLKILDVVRVWGSFHHESMDGHGYPFHLEENELPLGSRIVTVADIFTALTEDRPYRKGLPALAALEYLADGASHHRVDSMIVSILRENLEQVDAARVKAQQSSLQEFNEFIEQAELLTHKE